MAFRRQVFEVHGAPEDFSGAKQTRRKLAYFFFFFFQGASIAHGAASSDGHPAYTIRERHDFHSV